MNCKYKSEGVGYIGTPDGKGKECKTGRCIISFRANKFIKLFYKIFKCRNCKFKGGKIYYDNNMEI